MTRYTSSTEFRHARGAQAEAAICAGKDPLTWAQARAILDRQTVRHRGLTAYHCPICRAWHVGNPPKRNKRPRGDA